MTQETTVVEVFCTSCGASLADGAYYQNIPTTQKDLHITVMDHPYCYRCISQLNKNIHLPVIDTCDEQGRAYLTGNFVDVTGLENRVTKLEATITELRSFLCGNETKESVKVAE